MNSKNEKKPQVQTAENPSGEEKINKAHDERRNNGKVSSSQDDIEKEQQFKEAQTERD